MWVKPVSLVQSRATALREVLDSLLPSQQETLLLKACLESREIARAAWNDWLEAVRDPKSVFERNLAGLRGLLPFIRHALDRNGIDASDAFRVYLQVSSVREELRSNIYRKILGDSLSALQAAGCDVITLRAAALSETVYESNAIRHNHGIELLVSPSRIQHAVDALTRLAFTPQQSRRAWQRHSCSLVHRTGLPLMLHTRLLLLPHYRVSSGELWERSKKARLGGVETRILSPSDTMMDICAHASYSRSRMNLRWVCDAVLALRRYRELRWNTLCERVQRYRLTVPLWIMLEYLAGQMRAPIPDAVLAELAQAAAKTDRVSREAAIMGAMLGSVSPVSLIRRLRDSRRAQLMSMRRLLLPSRGYMRWRYGIERPWILPFVYVYRLLKFVALAVRRLARKPSTRAADDKAMIAEIE